MDNNKKYIDLFDIKLSDIHQVFDNGMKVIQEGFELKNPIKYQEDINTYGTLYFKYYNTEKGKAILQTYYDAVQNAFQQCITNLKALDNQEKENEQEKNAIKQQIKELQEKLSKLK